MTENYDRVYDELLVLKCQEGNVEAFEELVSRWQRRLWTYAYRLTEKQDVAYDVVQEVWVSIIRGIVRLRDPASFRHWAFRIVSNKCADWIRKQQRQRHLCDQLSAEIHRAEGTASVSTDRYISLEEALEKIRGDHHALLSLYYVEGFSIGEIAGILDIPEGTVKSRLHQARKRLRQLVEGYSNG